jgi:hypothetical protein
MGTVILLQAQIGTRTMESLLGLSKEQTRKKIVRQKYQRRFFWALGLVLLAIQITVAMRVSRTKPAALAETSPSTTMSGTQAMQSTPLTPPPLPPATHTATPATPSLPTATPATMASHTATHTIQPANPRTPTPTQVATHDRAGSSLNTGFGTHKATLTPSKTDPVLTLLSSPEQVTEQTFELTGTGQPQQTVSVLYNRSIIAQAQVDERGYWQATIPTAPLVRGDNTFILNTSATSTSVVSGSDNQLVFFKTTLKPWWLDAPLRLQASLGEGYACAPTVLGMAMDYYHQLDSSYPAPATTKLVQSLTQKGFVSGYGADAQMVCDLAIAYGYSHSFFYQEWSQAHLRQMLDAGHPVIANVRVGLSTDGYGHSVLVIGLSHDGQRVMFIDPAQGMVESSWARFDRSWASFGPPYRHGTVVKP